MSLNWTMIAADGTNPVPLPKEKVFLSQDACQVSITFGNPAGYPGRAGAKWEAPATVFVTNQRVIAIRQPALPPAQVQPSTLNTLSVPLSNLHDTRLNIPIFSASNFEASVITVRGGGFPEAPPGQASVGALKIVFREGGGATFRDAVEEVKTRLEHSESGTVEHMDDLPMYTPPADGASTSMLSSTAARAQPSADAGVPLPTPLVRRDSTCPPSADLEAAQVAGAQEEQEEADEQARHGGGVGMGPPAMDPSSTTGLSPGLGSMTESTPAPESAPVSALPPWSRVPNEGQAPTSPDDAPPGYEEATRGSS